jgi:DNA-binding transcriptional MerR regulator
VATATLLTLPQLAQAVGVEYRTLHSWLKRGLLAPSLQKSSGTGIPNLFTREDAIKAKVVADLRQAGLSFERLEETVSKLEEHPIALSHGAMILVNGSVHVTGAEAVHAAIRDECLTLVYNTTQAARAITDSLANGA